MKILNGKNIIKMENKKENKVNTMKMEIFHGNNIIKMEKKQVLGFIEIKKER